MSCHHPKIAEGSLHRSTNLPASPNCCQRQHTFTNDWIRSKNLPRIADWPTGTRQPWSITHPSRSINGLYRVLDSNYLDPDTTSNPKYGSDSLCLIFYHIESVGSVPSGELKRGHNAHFHTQTQTRSHALTHTPFFWSKEAGRLACPLRFARLAGVFHCVRVWVSWLLARTYTHTHTAMAFQPMVAKQHHSSMLREDGGALPVAGSSSSSSSCSRVPSLDSDLCCREDGGGWDKESPGTGTLSLGGAGGTMTAGAATTASNSGGSSTTSGARLPTSSERAQLRRSRPVDAGCAGAAVAGVGSRPFVGRPSGPPAERVDCLLKMFRVQQKFSPAGVNGSSGGRALCHSLSPFVAERRGLFVAWEVRER